MILKAKTSTSLFKGDVNFFTFRPSQLKPLNHLVIKKCKTDRERERSREKDILFSVIILLTAERHANKGYKAFFHDNFCSCDNAVVKRRKLGHCHCHTREQEKFENHQIHCNSSVQKFQSNRQVNAYIGINTAT